MASVNRAQTATAPVCGFPIRNFKPWDCPHLQPHSILITTRTPPPPRPTPSLSARTACAESWDCRCACRLKRTTTETATLRAHPTPLVPRSSAGGRLNQRSVGGWHDQDCGPQAILHLRVWEDDARALLLDHPAGRGDVFGEQVTAGQRRKVFNVRRQVQQERIAVLDDFAGHGKQLQAIQ